MQEKTPEQIQDIKERIESFRKEYSALVEKYQVDFVSYPQYEPSQDGKFHTVIVAQIFDKKYLPVVSPIQPESVIKG